ncbi:MAG: glycoside hydrolase family 76 protein, partial [Chthoniobacteraceae bacterium]
AFLATGNATYKELAKFHFDETYARAWNAELGGGLLWSTAADSKNACVNGPGAIAACFLYQILEDPSYREKAEAIYAWERSHLFDEDTGAVWDNMRADGRISRRVFSYNTGTFIGAANSLSKLTGDQTYLADAEKAADYTRARLCRDGILPDYRGGDASGFNGIFIRWLARFAGDNQRWPKYHGWLVQNANAAWSARRLDGLSWNRWQRPTPDDTLRAWACTDSVVVMQVIPLKPR